ncbi:protein of unknown function [Vibrio tapetis subsp. tapetis]|uniref:Uncharacterized protein n=1 Tax=Vibrio tapetis subsp. tapetis TaxID=1671868 RepID=A0A2N8ZN25_9VIBR|nr:protein of unknown function [Vibrio tapetis subsp. tapetis]
MHSYSLLLAQMNSLFLSKVAGNFKLFVRKIQTFITYNQINGGFSLLKR